MNRTQNAMTQSESKAQFGSFRQQLSAILRQHYILQKRYYVQTFVITVIAPVVVLLIILGLWMSTKDLIDSNELVKYQELLNTSKLPNTNLVVEDINKELATWDLPGLYQCEPPIREKTKCITLLYAPSNQQATKIMQIFADKNKERTGKDYSLQNPKVVDFAVSFEFPTVDRVEYTLWYNFTTVQNNTIYGKESQGNANSGLFDTIKNSVYSNGQYLDAGIDDFGNNLLSVKRGIEEAILAYSGFPNAKIDIKIKEFPDMQLKIAQDSNDNSNGANTEFNVDVFQSIGMFLVVPILMIFVVSGVMDTVREKEYGQRNWMEMIVAFVFSLLAFIYLSIVVIFWDIWYISEKKIAAGDFSKPQGTPAGWMIGLFLPFFQFGELYAQIVLKSTKTQFYPDNPGFNWNDLTNQTLYNNIKAKQFLPQPYRPLIIMSAQIIIYTMIVWIIDQGPKFYARNFGRKHQETLNDAQSFQHSTNSKDLDEDLANERSRALDLEQPSGKTTTISIIAGRLQPTSGYATIYDKDIITHMNLIRSSMGICPQHDLLYADLTCEEHITLFAGIKGIKVNVEELLAKVGLEKARNFPSSKLSGGMKRRLSVIIASIGDPKILILDEPTTGMDPLNRRQVWSFLSEYKKNRIILLTTHSMEEADLLGDRIGIMANGKLRAIGSSTHLKNKYGIGYRIQIQTDSENVESVQQWVSQLAPLAILQNADAGELIYQIPTNATTEIANFVDLLEDNPEGMINGWGIMNTTLEDVFLRISKEKEIKPIVTNNTMMTAQT
ncbi:7286_t:CDS:10 [Ambispora leptoticha]|uniref:7286_t:CDS:1 n=1 Tax=Ambispora leptoticha TaxID=144679 RepID=A0A9N8WNS8_9GLOM|nr:7286_t:CDS:10 [Ambispora leptoticha]